MACTLQPPCQIRPRSGGLSAYPTPEFGERAHGKKAAANEFLNQVWVDKAFWDTIPDSRAQLGLLCHEFAHLEGARCEECADRRGGQILASVGVEGEPAAEMLARFLEHRDGAAAAANFLGGYYGENDSRHADGAKVAGGTVDAAGLCKAPVLSFHSGETPQDRRAKAALRGIDFGACRWCHLEGPALAPSEAGLPYPVADSLRRWHDREHALLAAGLRRSTADAGMDRGADAPKPSAEAIAQELWDNAPSLRQRFTTFAEPAESLAQIIADAAVRYFPDDARRWAWIIAATLNGEAKPATPGDRNRSGGYYKAGDYNEAFAAPDTGGTTAYGLMQINDGFHPDMVGPKASRQWGPSTPASAQWADPRVNVMMGAEVLAGFRKQYPGDVRGEMTAYVAGKPTASDDVTAQIQKRIDWAAAQGANVLDDAQWGPPAAPGPVQEVADAARTVLDLAKGEQPLPRAKRNALWVGIASVLFVALLVVIYEVAERHPKPRRA